MPAYVVLANFTQQGIINIKNSPKRAEAFGLLAKTFGVTLKDILWTDGQFDLVITIEAPDDFSARTLILSLAAMGNVRTQMMRAYSAEEMKVIVDRML